MTPADRDKPAVKARSADEEAELQLGWRMAGLAFVFSSEAAAGAIIGLIIDHFAGTRPRWMLIGGIVGIAVGLLSFGRGALELNRMVSKQERARKAAGIPPPPPLPDEDDDDDDEDDKDND